MKQKRVLIIDNGTNYIESIIELCQRVDLQVYKVDWQNFKYQKLDFDLVILSGGHEISVDWHKKDFMEEIKLIKKAKCPVIGICLGFELIAKSFDSHLHKMDKNEKKELIIDIVENDLIFEGINKLVGYENHRWKVSKLGKNLIPLASSVKGIEIFKHKNKFIYGFQFHPEKSNYDDCGMKLFENIFTLIRLKK